MSGELVSAVVGSGVSLAAASLVYLGIRTQVHGAKQASDGTRAERAQESALEAWQELVAPLRAELRIVREELDAERRARAEDTHETRRRMSRQAEQIEKLRQEVRTWQQMARTIARWATALRDEVLRLGGTVPATPEELLTLQALDGSNDPPDAHNPPDPTALGGQA